MAVKIIKNVRIAFVDALWTMKDYNNDGKFRYRTNFLMAPDSESKKIIDATIKEVAIAKWGAKAKDILTQVRAAEKTCFIDGNTKTYNGYEGNWALTATRNPAIAPGAPLVVDLDGKTPITESSGRIYSGCYVNAKVDLWPQDNKQFGKGIRCTLMVVQYARDGESFGGAPVATTEGMDDLSFEESSDSDLSDDDFDL